MSDTEERCQTCRWWYPKNPTDSIGICDDPASVSTLAFQAKTRSTYSCSCYERKTTVDTEEIS